MTCIHIYILLAILLFSQIHAFSTPHPIYKFNTIPAPANSAATPTAPVRIGAKAPAVELPLAVPEGEPELEPALPDAANDAAVGVGVAPAVKPEVNGAAETELAPEKAAVCEDALGTGVAAVALGLRTWSMTWTTPLATRTSGMRTRALLTKMEPSSSMVMVRSGPAREGIFWLGWREVE